MSGFDSKFRVVVSLAGWAILYWLAAYISLLLDDPLSHVGFVWFPAGIGVSAFLVSEFRRWPWLLAFLFVAHLLADIHFSHDIPIAIALSAITLATDMATAWAVRRYAGSKDDLQIVLRWIIATFVISAIAAVLGSAWLAVYEDTPFDQLVWVWWGANVSGVLYVTAVIMGLRGFTLGRRAVSPRAKVVGLIAFAVMIVLSWMIFDLEHVDLMHGANERAPWRATLIFALTGIPIILAVIVAIACGNRMGALALLSLGAIVIYHSSEGTGPFFLRTLQPGDSLLLAQCYLVGAALLIVFLRVFTHSVRRYDAGADPLTETAYMYRIDASGSMDWDADITAAVNLPADASDSLAAMLESVHPDDRAALQKIMQVADIHSGSLAPVEFRLQSSDEQWISARAPVPTRIDEPEGAIVVGTWLISNRRTS